MAVERFHNAYRLALFGLCAMIVIEVFKEIIAKPVELHHHFSAHANKALAEAFGQQRIAVDTHVFRLANRIGFTAEKDVLGTEEALMKAIPKDKWVLMHHALIFHGRNCCTARNPKCSECCIAEYCRRNGM